MSTISSRLVCLECGQPIPDGQRWLCSGRCRAVMRLVRYGRSHPEQGLDPADPDLLNRHLRQARIVGRFPTFETVVEVRHHDHGQCQYPGCKARGAEHVDWRDDDPDLKRPVHQEDLRTLCEDHHRAESLRRFVGEGGHVARTGPAIWARIGAAKPLVWHDDQSVWDDPKIRRLLSDWPLANAQTRRDLDDWMESVREVTQETGGSDDRLDRLDALVGQLPRRRQKRLVSAITAVVMIVANERSDAPTQ